MSRLFFGSFLLIQLVSAGSYAPPPSVQPSISNYGTPLSYGFSSYGQLISLSPGNPSGGVGSLPSIASVVSPSVPIASIVPTLPTSPPQIYSYPIQSNQQTYNSPAPIYSDIVETTTLLPPPPPTTPFVPPVVEQVEDTEKYGVPEIPVANPQIVPPQPVSSPVVQQQGGYAPPPLVQPAASAYGAPPPYGGISNAVSYNELEFNAGEVPAAVVQPGTIPSGPLAPAPPAVASPYPARAIRSQKKTAEQRKKVL